jgi:hypothetical protein
MASPCSGWGKDDSETANQSIFTTAEPALAIAETNGPSMPVHFILQTPLELWMSAVNVCFLGRLIFSRFLFPLSFSSSYFSLSGDVPRQKGTETTFLLFFLSISANLDVLVMINVAVVL